MISRFIFLVFSLLLSLQVCATAQVPDYLIYNDQKLALHVNPLEKLFEEKKELRPETGTVSTANWRGYVATFLIENNSLFVADIKIEKPDPAKEHNYLAVSVLDKIFPSESDRELKWFSGLLVVPMGNRTGYIHLSYASQYEKYLILRVRNGNITDSVEMSLYEYMNYKRRQFQVFKQTEQYKKLYKELSKESEADDEFNLEGFIFQMGGFTEEIDIPFQ